MSDINNKISAKNVFDRHGLSLEGALDVLFSEMEKREIKRLYTEYKELGVDKLTANTMDLFKGMANETVAMISVNPDHAIAAEIGARHGGTLILFKKGGTYYSGGLFFTNKYGDLLIGTPGVGGRSFNWKRSNRYVHSLASFDELTVEAEGYQKIENFEDTSSKPILSVENGALTVPNYVSMVSVSANIVIESANGGKKSVAVFKNGEKTPIEIAQTIQGGDCANLCIAPVVISVCEGDVLDLRVSANDADVLKMKTFTVETLA